MKTINWGIIGPGSIAEDFAKDLALVEGSTHSVAAILTRDATKAAPFARQHKVKHVCTDVKEFIAAKPGAVYIATPHTLHHKHALACLRHRIPVICEKPITINTELLQELITAAEDHNTFLMEGMWTRFLPSIRKVMDIIEQGKIGDIISIKAGMGFKAPRDPDNRFFNPDLGGGSLLDLGVYPVFLATLLLGKPNEIQAVAAVSEEGVDEACSMRLTYPGKRLAILESTLLKDLEHAAEITGQKGRIKILERWTETPQGIQLEIYDDSTTLFPCKWPGRGFQFEVEEVVKCLQQNAIESSLMPHQFSMQVMEIMDEIRYQVNVKYEKYE